MFELVYSAIAEFVVPRTLETLADKVHDKVLDEAASRLVGAIFVSQAEQTRLLRSVDAKVDALLQGPYHTGLLYLEDAAVAERTPEQRARALEHAHDAFMEALGVEGADPLRACVIRVQLGLVHLARDAWRDAERAFERAQLDMLWSGERRMRRGLLGWDGSAVRPLAPLADQLRALRVAMGQHEATVPSIAPMPEGSPRAWSKDVAAPDNEPDRLPPSDIPGRLSGTWRELDLLPTDTLERVAGADPRARTEVEACDVSGAISAAHTLIRDPDGDIHRVGPAIRPDEVGAADVREAAGLMARYRRAGYPPRHRHGLGA